MDRNLINKELNRIGLDEYDYVRALITSFMPVPEGKGKNLNAVQLRFRKSYVSAESYIKPGEGIVDEEPLRHTHILTATEDEKAVLDSAKNLAYNKGY